MRTSCDFERLRGGGAGGRGGGGGGGGGGSRQAVERFRGGCRSGAYRDESTRMPMARFGSHRCSLVETKHVPFLRHPHSRPTLGRRRHQLRR
ncbi:MAG: hypothetical protein E6Q97_35415 [Desulfurellales bacterium]|nr:MAG: hypothetical protein E6Q97_35415 [Desulfurellales bacterium]